ncbi:hypothetical protein P692DRAFT_201856590 [Suillus brevipes Sb2]|nr:hypothetical protein P692DRAFT_201856590 [Suillus brevipes Sb2]
MTVRNRLLDLDLDPPYLPQILSTNLSNISVQIKLARTSFYVTGKNIVVILPRVYDGVQQADHYEYQSLSASNGFGRDLAVHAELKVALRRRPRGTGRESFGTKCRWSTTSRLVVASRTSAGQYKDEDHNASTTKDIKIPIEETNRSLQSWVLVVVTYFLPPYVHYNYGVLQTRFLTALALNQCNSRLPRSSSTCVREHQLPQSEGPSSHGEKYPA